METQVTEKKYIFEYEFHLKKIRATNFRLFSEIEMELHPKLNVFIGVNGAGKTTILDIISKMLLFFIKSLRNERLKEKEVMGNIFNNGDIKIGTYQTICAIETNISSTKKKTKNEITYSIEEERIDNETNSIIELSELNWNSSFKKNSFKGINFDDEQLLDSTIHKIQSQIQRGHIVRLPIVLHINSDGYIENNFIDELSGKPHVLNTYDNALQNTGLDIKTFEQWYKWQEIVDKEKNYIPEFRATREAICSILSDEKTTFSNLKTTWIENRKGDLTIQKNNDTIKINQLSSGEKRVMEIAARIAYKLAIANPGKSNVLEGSGVVLIDEIDLHLHPQWQRKIIPQLQKTFPNIQFVVTTHSPLVIQNVEKENVKILEDGKLIEEVPLVFGRDTNTVLYEVFGTEERPQDIQRLIDECFLLLEDDNIEKGKEKLLELSKIIGENDKEIIRANSYLKFISE